MVEVCVIVPVYKVEPYLHRCVDSILAQTYTDFELILVDDGSPDNCPAICDEYAAKDSRVKVIHKANGGLSSARNAGLDITAGEYVLFVDSDDWIAPETLEKTLDTAHRTGSDMVIFDYTDVYEDGTASRRKPNDFAHEEEWTHDEFWQKHHGGFNVLCVVAWNKLCKRSLFEDLRYEMGRIHEDEIIIYDLVKRSNHIAFLNEAFYFYFHRGTSITGTRGHKSMIDTQYAFLRRASQFAADGNIERAVRLISEQIEQFKRCDSSWKPNEKRVLFKTMRMIRRTKYSVIWPYLTWKRRMTMLLLYLSPCLFLFGTRVGNFIKRICGLFRFFR